MPPEVQSVKHTGISLSDGVTLPTSHFYRPGEGFFERLVSPDVLARFSEKVQRTLIDAGSLACEVHAGSTRRGQYLQLDGNPTDTPRAYVTHVEGVLQLLLYFLPPEKIGIVPMLATLFHDVFEDCTPENIEKVLQFLKQNVSQEEVEQIVQIILFVTKPNLHQNGLYGIIEAEKRSQNDMSVTYIRKYSRIAITVANQIFGDMINRCDGIHTQWSSADVTNHDTPFCAPRDADLGKHISTLLGEDGTIPHTLNNYGLDVSAITDLYRFVEHCFYVWWEQHGRSFDGFGDEKKFHKRIADDLSSILQVMLMSEFTETASEQADMKQLVIWLKLLDQLYNTWDNHYLESSEIKESEKFTEYLFKAKLLFMRANMYEKLLLSQIGQDSDIHKVYSAVKQEFQRILLAVSSSHIRTTELLFADA